MRLINTSTLKITEFVNGEALQYIILSHTWGENEISFQQFQDGMLNDKIRNCCYQARKDGFQYAWIDTCCIDKTSSAELSEAINSMYKWYKGATICYVYLEDFVDVDGNIEFALRACRWFKRGWTLQELVAPSAVEFYAPNWVDIGTKMSLGKVLSTITGIPLDALAGTRNLKYYNVAERMSWASGRSTTRKEDEAYSLLGLFNVHMPLLYGEGRNAFQRLQEEILKTIEDNTIFAWPRISEPGQPPNKALRPGSLFAVSPAAFRTDQRDYNYSDLQRRTMYTVFPLSAREALPLPPRMTSRGLNITLPIRSRDELVDDGLYLAVISTIGHQHLSTATMGERKFICIKLRIINVEMNTFGRVLLESPDLTPIEFKTEELKRFSYETINVPLFNWSVGTASMYPIKFGLQIDMCPSMEATLELSRVFRMTEGSTMASVPIGTYFGFTQRFKFGNEPSGVLVLHYGTAPGTQIIVLVFFGIAGNKPWCRGDAPLTGFDLKDTTDLQLSQMLWDIYRHQLEAEPQFFENLADRWKGKLVDSVSGGAHAIKIAIKRAPDRISSMSELMQMFSLSVSVAIEDPVHNTIGLAE